MTDETKTPISPDRTKAEARIVDRLSELSLNSNYQPDRVNVNGERFYPRLPDGDGVEAAEVIQSLIDTYSTAGANLLDWLTEEDIAAMPLPRRHLGLFTQGPSANDWQVWASDVARRAVFEALKLAENNVSTLAATKASELKSFRFGPWTIDHNPKPIPPRCFDWDYWHEGDDGAPDGSSARSGSAGSPQSCLDAIHELMEDAAPDKLVDPPSPEAAYDMGVANERKRCAEAVLALKAPTGVVAQDYDVARYDAAQFIREGKSNA